MESKESKCDQDQREENRRLLNVTTPEYLASPQVTQKRTPPVTLGADSGASAFAESKVSPFCGQPSSTAFGPIESKSIDGSGQDTNTKKVVKSSSGMMAETVYDSSVPRDSPSLISLDGGIYPLPKSLTSSGSAINVHAPSLGDKPLELSVDAEFDFVSAQVSNSSHLDGNHSTLRPKLEQEHEKFSFETKGHLLQRANMSAVDDLSSRPFLSAKHYACLKNTLGKEFNIWPRPEQELCIFTKQWTDETLQAKVKQELKLMESSRNWKCSFFPALPPAQYLAGDFLSLQAALEIGPDALQRFCTIGILLLNRNNNDKVVLYMLTCAHLLDVPCEGTNSTTVERRMTGAVSNIPEVEDDLYANNTSTTYLLLEEERSKTIEQHITGAVSKITEGEDKIHINDINNTLSTTGKGIVNATIPLIARLKYIENIEEGFSMDALLAKLEVEPTLETLNYINRYISYKDTFEQSGTDLRVKGIWEVSDKRDMDALLGRTIYIGIGNTLFKGMVVDAPSGRIQGLPIGYSTMITATFQTPLYHGQSGSAVYLEVGEGCLCLLGIVCNRLTFTRELREKYARLFPDAEWIKIMPVYPFLEHVRAKSPQSFTLSFKTISQYCSEVGSKVEPPQSLDSAIGQSVTSSVNRNMA